MPWMPSLARVMPVISLVMLTSSSNALLVTRHAFLGVAVAVILKHLLHDLGLEFAVGALGHLGQVEILNRIAVDVEFEVTAQRGEIGFLESRRDRLFVGEVALDR